VNPVGPRYPTGPRSPLIPLGPVTPFAPVGPRYPDNNEKVTVADSSVATSESELEIYSPIPYDVVAGRRRMAEEAI
jgi:hypothetical protein